MSSQDQATTPDSRHNPVQVCTPAGNTHRYSALHIASGRSPKGVGTRLGVLALGEVRGRQSQESGLQTKVLGVFIRGGHLPALLVREGLRAGSECPRGHVLSVPHSVPAQGASAPGCACPSPRGSLPARGQWSVAGHIWIEPPAFAATADLFSFRGRFENVACHLRHYEDSE